MRQVVIAVSVLAMWASAALVAQVRYLPDAPGRWKPWTFTAYGDNRRAVGATAAELKDLEAQLLRLTAIIKNTNGITNPIGFSVETAGRLDPVVPRLSLGGGLAATARPLPASFSFGAFGIHETSNGQRSDTGETAQLSFFVNQLQQPLFAESNLRVPEFETIDADVTLLAPSQPEMHGFPRYGETLVLKKSAEPIWAAVTLAETLDLAGRSLERRLVNEREMLARVQAAYDDMKDPKKREERIAQYRKIAPLQKDPAYVDKMTKVEDAKATQADTLLPQIASSKAVVSKSEQQLVALTTKAAGLSAEDRAAPGCYAVGGTGSLSRFRRGPAAGCNPLVRANWKLFNPKLPRSAPQVLTISSFVGRCSGEGRTFLHAGGCTANRRLIESIDKAALLAWLQ